jgi:very-short-patch-repair endonuclease
MSRESSLGALSRLSASSLGVFRGHQALKLGVSRKQLTRLSGEGVIARELPDTYRMTAAPRSTEQSLRAALLWAGADAAAAGRSAAEIYGLETARARRPEIVVPRTSGVRSANVFIQHCDDFGSLMIRQRRGLRVTGVEATLVALAHSLDAEAFEIACEDARRRRLTSVAALRSYLDKHGRAGRRGIGPTRELLGQVDPVYAARSTLEVKARRLLVANGFTDFVREFPLEWKGRTYRFDFAFETARTILETNGRRWHDDANDYEHDNEKWSVPGRHGFRLVLATWAKITETPDALIEELAATVAACATTGGQPVVLHSRPNQR